MLDVNTKAIKKLESQLKAFQEKALPFATKGAVNGYAFLAMKNAKNRIASDFVNRNKFTERSIRVNTTKSLDVNKQVSTVGSTADYMRTQETGGIKTKKGKHGVPIPTSASAGLSDETKPRTKTPLPRNKIKSIRLRYSRSIGKTRKQANIIAIKKSLKESQKYVYLEFTRKKGIFRITGNLRTLELKSLKMMYDLSEDTVRIPQHKWLEPSANLKQHEIDRIYFKQLKFQLERNNLFKKI